MRETIRLTGELAEDTLPDEVRERFLDAFRSWKGGRT
jgi:hypothetical protein